jgi:predicted nucleic acid-binding protein
MKAVVNATPLIALALLDRLELLRQMFDEVLVPAAVYEEVVVKGAGRPGAAAVEGADWLRMVSPDAASTIEPMLLGLDAGEMDVLLLAREQRPDWVLIDERLGRSVARAMGLPVKGTLGVLLAAVLAGFLPKTEALHGLQLLADSEIRISARWQEWLENELDKLE